MMEEKKPGNAITMLTCGGRNKVVGMSEEGVREEVGQKRCLN